MVYDLAGLAKNIKINGRFYSVNTIRDRAKKGTLPSYIKVYKFKCGYVFEIQQMPDNLKGFTVLIRPTIKPR